MASPGMPQPTGRTIRIDNGVIKSGAGWYYGYIVTTDIATGPVTIYDNTSGSGQVIDVVPTGTTAGTQRILPVGVPVANGIYTSWGGTGRICVVHDGT